MTITVPKKYLFVTGIQRSGTTALANTLNWHDEIAVCIERFKYLINDNKIDQFCPAMFEEEHLFDFSTNYTNCTPSHSKRFADYYRELQNKYSSLKYVGDKIANDPNQIQRIYEKFPDSKIIFIVRDIYDIACSWQTRADKTDDKWPADKTAIQSVEPWNQFNNLVKMMHTKHPDDVFIVDYGRYFGDNADDLTQLEQLSNFLGIAVNENAARGLRHARQQYRNNIANKPRNLKTDAREYIDSNSDFGLYQQVTSMSAAKDQGFRNSYPDAA